MFVLQTSPHTPPLESKSGCSTCNVLSFQRRHRACDTAGREGVSEGGLPRGLPDPQEVQFGEQGEVDDGEGDVPAEEGDALSSQPLRPRSGVGRSPVTIAPR